MSTTKVKFLTCVSSNEWGCYNTGDEAEIPSDEATRLEAAGFVEVSKSGSTRETASRNPVKKKAVRE